MSWPLWVSSSVPVLGYASGHALRLAESVLWPVEVSGGRYNGAGIAGLVHKQGPQQRLSRRKEGQALLAGGGQALEPEPKGHQASIAPETGWCLSFLFLFYCCGAARWETEPHEGSKRRKGHGGGEMAREVTGWDRVTQCEEQ